LGGCEESGELPADVALEYADDLAVAGAVGGAPGEVGARCRGRSDLESV
jgi:hypothetical protein